MTHAKLTTFRKPGNFIAGRFVAPSRPDEIIESKSPADTQDVVGIHPVSLRGVERAVAAAKSASRSWAMTSEAKRLVFLRRYQKRLQKKREVIALTIAREVGKPLWEAKQEVDAMVRKLDLCVDPSLRPTAPRSVESPSAEVRYKPLGVVAVVGPYNFPGHLPNGQILPALLEGNAVVFKPSDKAPTVGCIVASCFAEAGLPPGVLNLIQGGAKVGAKLTGHPDVRAVLFTGSAAVGRAIQVQNAGDLGKLIALELGGKNAALIHHDCLLSEAAREVAFSAFATAGQRCSATSRVIVHRRVLEPFLSHLVQIARSIGVGYPLDKTTFMGPMISEQARKRLRRAQRSAIDAGFEALHPGRQVQVLGHPGYYMQPAIHLAPNREVLVPTYQHEELFGPDLAVFAADSLDEAITLSNRSKFGLSAAVFTQSKKSFERAASTLEVGVIHWNRGTAGASGSLPFGGWKESGNYRPGGSAMGACCAAVQSVLMPRAELPANWPGFPERSAAATPP